MVKCADCGFEECELAYTGEPDPLCCECFLKIFPTFDDGNCSPCEKRLKEKEKILQQQTSLEEFIHDPQ
jgi:hypothetical protein